jgi:hypothetical protein
MLGGLSQQIMLVLFYKVIDGWKFLMCGAIVLFSSVWSVTAIGYDLFFAGLNLRQNGTNR